MTTDARSVVERAMRSMQLLDQPTMDPPETPRPEPDPLPDPSALVTAARRERARARTEQFRVTLALPSTPPPVALPDPSLVEATERMIFTRMMTPKRTHTPGCACIQLLPHYGYPSYSGQFWSAIRNRLPMHRRLFSLDENAVMTHTGEITYDHRDTVRIFDWSAVTGSIVAPGRMDGMKRRLAPVMAFCHILEGTFWDLINDQTPDRPLAPVVISLTSPKERILDLMLFNLIEFESEVCRVANGGRERASLRGADDLPRTLGTAFFMLDDDIAIKAIDVARAQTL